MICIDYFETISYTIITPIATNLQVWEYVHHCYCYRNSAAHQHLSALLVSAVLVFNHSVNSYVWESKNNDPPRSSLNFLESDPALSFPCAKLYIYFELVFNHDYVVRTLHIGHIIMICSDYPEITSCTILTLIAANLQVYEYALYQHHVWNIAAHQQLSAFLVSAGLVFNYYCFLLLLVLTATLNACPVLALSWLMICPNTLSSYKE